MKTSDLIGEALNWSVAIAVENSRAFPIWIDGKPQSYADYANDWAHAGPIIEREGITLRCYKSKLWDASIGRLDYVEDGPTPLIAAMRCYVASKLGDVVNWFEGAENV